MSVSPVAALVLLVSAAELTAHNTVAVDRGLRGRSNVEGAGLWGGAVLGDAGRSQCAPAAASVARWRGTTFAENLTLSHISYINLNSSTSRRSFMESQLSQWTVPYSRLPAVTSATAQHDPRFEGMRKHGFQRYLVGRSGKPSWGRAAITFSHYLAISEAAARRDGGLTLILEDDVQCVPQQEFQQKLRDLGQHLPSDWDLLKLSWFGERSCTEAVNDFVDVGCAHDENRICNYCGLQAYVVNPRSYDKVLQRIRSSPIGHCDATLARYSLNFHDGPCRGQRDKESPLNTYVSMQQLAKHTESFGTDVRD